MTNYPAYTRAGEGGREENLETRACASEREREKEREGERGKESAALLFVNCAPRNAECRRRWASSLWFKPLRIARMRKERETT